MLNFGKVNMEKILNMVYSRAKAPFQSNSSALRAEVGLLALAQSQGMVSEGVTGLTP